MKWLQNLLARAEEKQQQRIFEQEKRRVEEAVRKHREQTGRLK